MRLFCGQAPPPVAGNVPRRMRDRQSCGIEKPWLQRNVSSHNIPCQNRGAYAETRKKYATSVRSGTTIISPVRGSM